MKFQAKEMCRQNVFCRCKILAKKKWRQKTFLHKKFQTKNGEREKCWPKNFASKVFLSPKTFFAQFIRVVVTKDMTLKKYITRISRLCA